MTAHELARKLLEGPDVLVVHAVDVNYGCEEEPREITSAEPVTLYQAEFNGIAFDLSFEAPRNKRLPCHETQAVKLA